MTDDMLAHMRHPYGAARLLEADMMANPFEQFRTWLHDVLTAGMPEPNAMVLATATTDARPSSRHVLLKELDDEGFVFFTNLGSRKAMEIAANPQVSLCFPWFAMERQVVVGGRAVEVPRAETEAYWRARPRESQVGAWASRQSTVVASRQLLEEAAAAVEKRYPGTIPVPEFWGGYRVVPETVEFWQGGPGRLHDRLRYRRTGDRWLMERLAP